MIWHCHAFHMTTAGTKVNLTRTIQWLWSYLIVSNCDYEKCATKQVSFRKKKSHLLEKGLKFWSSWSATSGNSCDVEVEGQNGLLVRLIFHCRTPHSFESTIPRVMKSMRVHRGSAVPNPVNQVDLDEGEEIKRSENSIKMFICCTAQIPPPTWYHQMDVEVGCRSTKSIFSSFHTWSLRYMHHGLAYQLSHPWSEAMTSSAVATIEFEIELSGGNMSKLCITTQLCLTRKPCDAAVIFSLTSFRLPTNVELKATIWWHLYMSSFAEQRNDPNWWLMFCDAVLNLCSNLWRF